MTLHPISAGSGIDYLMRTVVSDDERLKARDLAGYWSTGGDTPGVWIGTQAAALGLSGQVSQEAADAIFKDGINPVDGTPLGRKWPKLLPADELYERKLAKEPNATEARKVELRKEADDEGNKTPRAGWESVFSPVKSWSILWGVSNDDMRRELEAAEQAAFAKVWAQLESSCAWTRVGRAGVAQVETQGLIAAGFVHRSSRAGDPDYHRHVAISAKVQTEDGRWLALDARPLHRMTVALSEQYTTELEREMWERFGILAAPRDDSIRPDKRPVREFLGISSETVGLFSQRRKQTEKALAQLTRQFVEREGREPSRPEQYALAQAAALTARPDKVPGTVGEERRQWRRRLWRAGVFMPQNLVAAARRASARLLTELSPPRPLADVAGAVLAVLETQRESWTRANVQAEAYRQLTAARWHIAAGDQFDQVVTDMVDHVLHPDRCELITPPEPVTIPSRYLRIDGSSIFVQHGAERFTSHRIKEWEADLLEAATRPTTVLQLTAEQIDAALAAGEATRGFTPTEQQRAAVHAVFSGDVRLQAIIGYAGTGKTTIMAMVREVADRHGIAVIGLAGGQVQADTLAEAAGIRAENIRRWLTMSETYAKGKPQWTLPRNAVVIVDEAGQASTPDLHAILQQVEAAGGRMLPIGDPRQLGSPGVGGALVLLEADSEAVHLTEVRRFRSVDGDLRQWEIDAANAIAAGDAEASYEAYASRGRLHAGPLAEMVDLAYRNWSADVADGLTSVLIAPTNALAAQLSDRARTDRVAAGIVDDSRVITLPDGNRVGAGDQIVTRVNNRLLKCEDTRQFVRNGDVWSVEEVRRDGSLVARHGITKNRVLLPADYASGGAVELGYSITKDRVQGVTVKTGHPLLTPDQNANMVYPEMTRGMLANSGYICTDMGVDVESGEPGRPLTGRQAWAGMVTRSGTQLSATALQRAAFDDAESLRTQAPRLHYVLDDIADAETRRAIIRLIGPTIGELVTTAPAWPAVRQQLLQLADDGYDTDALVVAAHDARAWTGDIEDHARILHSRIRKRLETHPSLYLIPEEELATAPRPATAATYEEEPRAVADNFVAAYGLRLPDPQDEHRDDRHEMVDELVALLETRYDYLAHQAQQDARDGIGWAAAYGPEPEDLAGAVAWRDRIAAAAGYRDAAGYTGADATGPTPTDERDYLRGLWRAAQTVREGADAYGHALQLAHDGATWLDAVGPLPAPGDATRPAWVAAVTALDTYRELWGYGHETVSSGAAPTDPVQRADYEHASTAVAAYRLVKEVPSLADADPETLAVIIADGNTSLAQVEAAAEAVARYDTARRTEIAAAQAAEDAANRAAEARDATGDQEVPAERVAELADQAEQARVAAEHASAEVDTARQQVEATAPGAVEAREQVRRAEQARRVLAHKRLNPGPDEGPAEPRDPADPRPHDQRPHGDLDDRELVNASQRAVAEAVEIERGAPQRDVDPAGAQAAEQAATALRERAAELREEYRNRAVMEPEQRQAEDAARAAAREQAQLEEHYAGAGDRLAQLYQGADPAEAERTERAQRAAHAEDVARAEQAEQVEKQAHRAEDEQPVRPPANDADRRLQELYGQQQAAAAERAEETARRPRPEEPDNDRRLQDLYGDPHQEPRPDQAPDPHRRRPEPPRPPSAPSI